MPGGGYPAGISSFLLGQLKRPRHRIDGTLHCLRARAAPSRSSGPLGRPPAVQLPTTSWVGALPEPQMWADSCWRCFVSPGLLALLQFPGWAGNVRHLDGPASPLPPAAQTLVKIAQRTSVKINGVVKG